MDTTLWDNAVNNAVGNLGICGKLLETIDKDVAKEYLGKFENCVEEYCNLDIVHQSTIEALEQTKEFFANNENDTQTKPKKIFDQYYQKANKPTVKNHPLRDMYNKEIKGATSAVDSSIRDEDDIISTNQFVPPIDPISKEPIKNPVRNVKCGHIYDRDTITQMVERKNMRCPYIGCPSKHHIQIEKLETDHEMKRKIDRHFLNE